MPAVQQQLDPITLAERDYQQIISRQQQQSATSTNQKGVDPIAIAERDFQLITQQQKSATQKEEGPSTIKALAQRGEAAAIRTGVEFNKLIEGLANVLTAGFRRALGLGKIKLPAYFTEQPEAKAKQLEFEALHNKYAKGVLGDLVASLSSMGVTMPLDVITGSATKLALAPRILERVVPYLESIPDFAIGMAGRRAIESAQKHPGGKGTPQTAKETLESLASGILYGKVGQGLKGIANMTAIGAGEAALNAVEQGRKPTVEELKNGAIQGLGFGLLFNTVVPAIRRVTKVPIERIALKQLEDSLASGDMAKAQKGVEKFMQTKGVRPQVKEAVIKTLEEASKPVEGATPEALMKELGIAEEKPAVQEREIQPKQQKEKVTVEKPKPTEDRLAQIASVDSIERAGVNEQDLRGLAKEIGLQIPKKVKPDEVLARLKREAIKRGLADVDLTTTKGQPFKSKTTALAQIKKLGLEDAYEPIEVEGGWIGRKKQAEDMRQEGEVTQGAQQEPRTGQVYEDVTQQKTPEGSGKEREEMSAPEGGEGVRGGGQETAPQVMSLEEFLASKGVSKTPPSFPEYHRKPGGVSKQAERQAARRVSEALAKWQEEKNRAEKEYNRLVEEGKLRPPSHVEQLKRIAEGEGEAAKAASRVLAKREKKGGQGAGAKETAPPSGETAPAVKTLSTEKVVDALKKGGVTPERAREIIDKVEEQWPPKSGYDIAVLHQTMEKQGIDRTMVKPDMLRDALHRIAKGKQPEPGTETEKPEPKQAEAKQPYEITKDQYYEFRKKQISKIKSIPTAKQRFLKEKELAHWGEAVTDKYPTFGMTDEEVHQWIANIKRDALKEYNEALQNYKKTGKTGREVDPVFGITDTPENILKRLKESLELANKIANQTWEQHKRDKALLYKEGYGWRNPDIILKHKATVAQALKENKLTPEQYDKLHAKDYGEYGSEEFRKNFPEIAKASKIQTAKEREEASRIVTNSTGEEIVIKKGDHVRVNKNAGSGYVVGFDKNVVLIKADPVTVAEKAKQQETPIERILDTNLFDLIPTEEVSKPTLPRVEVATGPVEKAEPAVEKKPFGDVPAEMEYEWAGTRVKVNPPHKGAQPYTGTVERVLNNGEVIEVKPDDYDTTFRVPSDRVEILEKPIKKQTIQEIYDRGKQRAEERLKEEVRTYDRVLGGVAEALKAKGKKVTPTGLAERWHDPLAMIGDEADIDSVITSLEAKLKQKTKGLRENYETTKAIEPVYPSYERGLPSAERDLKEAKTKAAGVRNILKNFAESIDDVERLKPDSDAVENAKQAVKEVEDRLKRYIESHETEVKDIKKRQAEEAQTKKKEFEQSIESYSEKRPKKPNRSSIGLTKRSNAPWFKIKHGGKTAYTNGHIIDLTAPSYKGYEDFLDPTPTKLEGDQSSIVSKLFDGVDKKLGEPLAQRKFGDKSQNPDLIFETPEGAVIVDKAYYDYFKSRFPNATLKYDPQKIKDAKASFIAVFQGKKRLGGFMSKLSPSGEEYNLTEVREIISKKERGKLADKLKNETGSSEIINILAEHTANLMRKGYYTFKEVKNRIKEDLGELWEKFKKFVAPAYQIAKKKLAGQEGFLSFKKKEEVTPELEQAQKELIERFKKNKEKKAPLELKPFIAKQVEGIKSSELAKFWHGLKKEAWRIFMPEKLAGELGKRIDAELASTIRKEQRLNWIMMEALNKKAEWWDKIPKEGRIEYLDALERNDIQKIRELSGNSDVVFKVLMADKDLLRNGFDYAYKLEQNVGIDYDYVEHYITHLWKDPKKAKLKFQQYRLNIGKEKFAKQRVIDLIRTGLDLGLELKTSNPFEIAMIRVESAHRSVVRQQMFDKLENEGLAFKIKDVDKKDLAGEWIEVNAPNGSSYFVPAELEPLLINAGMVMGKGKSLWTMDNPLGQTYRGLMRIKNAYIPIKLGLSAFHLVHILGIDMSAQRAAIYQKMLSGMSYKDAVKELSRSFANFAAPRVLKQAGDVIEAFKKPKSQLTDYEKEAISWVIDGGMGVNLSDEWRIRAQRHYRQTTDNFVKKTGITAIGDILQAMQKPLFEVYIPRLKMAAYLAECEAALRKNPKLASDDAARRKAFREIAKSIDNRYGEMQYDTLFWNRLVKDIGIGSMLSMGWNLGFAREYYKGIKDTAKLVYKAARGKATKADLTSQMFFVMDYTAQAMFIGGLLTYLMTGKLPTQMLDFFYPKTGEKNPDGSDARFNMPYYSRIFFEMEEHYRKQGLISGAWHMMINKANPALAPLIRAFITNKTFYNVDIRDPDAPFLDQMTDVLKYLGQETLPISWQSYLKAKEAMPKRKAAVSSFLGFTMAPSYITQDRPKQWIFEEYDRIHGGGRKTKEEGKKLEIKRKLRQEYIRTGKIKKEHLDTAIKQGVFGRGTTGQIRSNIKKFLKSTFIVGDIRAFKGLGSDIQIKLLEKMIREGEDKAVARYYKVAHPYVKIYMQKYYKSKLNEILSNK